MCYKLQAGAPLHQVEKGSELKASLHKEGGSPCLAESGLSEVPGQHHFQSWKEPPWSFLKASCSWLLWAGVPWPVVTLFLESGVHVLCCRLASVLSLLKGWWNGWPKCSARSRWMHCPFFTWSRFLSIPWRLMFHSPLITSKNTPFRYLKTTEVLKGPCLTQILQLFVGL